MKLKVLPFCIYIYLTGGILGTQDLQTDKNAVGMGKNTVRFASVHIYKDEPSSGGFEHYAEYI